MSRELKTEVDLSGLNKFNAQLLGALIGSGQGGMGDAQRFIKTEAGQLAWDISSQMGPKSLSKAGERIGWDMKRHLTTAPKYISAEFNDGRKQESESYSEFTWLTAGKGRNGSFLLGINNEDMQMGATPDAAKKMLRVGQKGSDRGDAYQRLGRRGKSAILRLNRVKISASTFSAVKKSMIAKVGQLRASFAYTASVCLPSKPIPGWIRKHFTGRAGGKIIFSESGLNSASPSITFGSSAKGVQSNPYIVDKIARAVESRKYKMAEKIKKIVKGYTYNWNTGGVFKQVVPSGGMQ
jgi:hypothetical protein